MEDDLKGTIQNALSSSEVYILDPMQDGVHLEAIVISPDFEGMTLIQQHQKVMHSLKGHFNSTLHALGLRTFTPEKWEDHKHKYQTEE